MRAGIRTTFCFLGLFVLLVIWLCVPLVQHEVDRTGWFWLVWSAVGLGVLGGIAYLAKETIRMSIESRTVLAFWGFYLLVTIWPLVPLLQHQTDRTLEFWIIWGAIGFGTVCGIICLAKRNRDEQRK